MSELININDNRAAIRWKLLTGVSALALTAYVSSTAIALAEDSGQPIVWIELGGEAERVGDAPELFSPPFFGKASPADLTALTGAQRPPPYTAGFEGKLSFEPNDSDWILSAAIRYGRSGTVKHKHHQTDGLPPFLETIFGKYISAYQTPKRVRYSDVHSSVRESHSIIDFEAGKDVGLGMFGAQSHSILSAGVKFAQFATKSQAAIHARPTYNIYPPHGIPGKYQAQNFFRATYSGLVRSSRDTHGVGPSLSWDASVPVAGKNSDMTLNVDWGLNAAVLFGRQRAMVRHQTHGYHVYVSQAVFHPGTQITAHYTHGPYDRERSRNVTIPNAGAFAGFSLKFPNAKVSIGYRADIFFGALDGGIDTRKSENREFYGPFASISVGLGD